ncbi:hypothetical protein GGX14DRAFT_601523 [Mycena pura]|uniref:Uncharacterized protein n=1 Tax=Mycena pura TaxID=153505 RepID=A0AAD6UV35_9AGAR|nr:hypothetical protein GGX14DRAFT_601523 [Mycena pura]
MTHPPPAAPRCLPRRPPVPPPASAARRPTISACPAHSPPVPPPAVRRWHRTPPTAHCPLPTVGQAAGQVGGGRRETGQAAGGGGKRVATGETGGRRAGQVGEGDAVYPALFDLATDAHELLRARLAERTGADGDALELAMRLVALRLPGAGVVYDGGDGGGDGDGTSRAPVRRLLSLQDDDGGQTGWLCRYGHTGMRLGNRYLTSALAIEALGALALPKDSRA